MVAFVGPRYSVFRLLVVEDNPADVYLLKDTFRVFSQPYQVDWAKDGVEALNILFRRGPHEKALRPDLILMDINMPGLSGLEVLRTIKSDPDLMVVPVVMFSASAWPEEVQQSYRAHANCYVQKPTNLDEYSRFVRAIESFWIEFAMLPGPSRAGYSWEASSETLSTMDGSVANEALASGKAGCEEHNRLLDEFGAAVREILRLHQEQFRAIAGGDTESNRFDLLIHMANEKKQLAKYAYIRHLESHSCSNIDAINKTRT